jgi:proton-coupled amino acid transporter
MWIYGFTNIIDLIRCQFFVFEGSITLIVPLQEAVFHEEDKKKFPAVNQVVTSWIVVFYIFFAISCWAAFGDTVKTALTASLPEGGFSAAVQFVYSLAVIFTFPLQAFPALEVVFHPSDKTRSIIKRNILASIVISLLGVVAYLAIDYLGNVVSLLGSLVGIPIALIYPPLMHNRMVKNGSKWTKLLNNCVAVLGVFAMGAASFTTIMSWDKGSEG